MDGWEGAKIEVSGGLSLCLSICLSVSLVNSILKMLIFCCTTLALASFLVD